MIRVTEPIDSEEGIKQRDKAREYLLNKAKGETND